MKTEKKGNNIIEISAETVWKDIKKIRAQKPLIHNITNYVVMNTTANALLSLGASPVMAHAIDEVFEMVNLANALVINIGTLSKPWVQAMENAILIAKEKKIPIVFDPVGAGATSYRTNTAKSLISLKSLSVIRGNSSEIQALIGNDSKTKGVDSIASSQSAIPKAQDLSRNLNTVISISGEIDYIISMDQIIGVKNGVPMMTQVTGLGCTASALTGAFVAVNKSYFQAAIHAMIVMGITGELTKLQSKGPGSFQMNFLDTLYNLSYDDIKNRINVVDYV